MNVSELLGRFTRDRSEEVFSELMRGYVNLVYSVANRRLNDPTQVEEVVQDVFIRFARLDKLPTSEAELVGWFHASAHRVSIDRWRKDSRRHDREMKAFEMIPTEPHSKSAGNEMAPVLDDAIAELEPVERTAILLRYFKDAPFKSVAEALGVTDAAAKMRVSRALDKLRSNLLRKGVSCSALALAAMLDEKALGAAPTDFANRVVSRVRVSGRALQIKSPAIFGFKTVVACLLIGTTLLIWLEQHSPSRSRGRHGLDRPTTQRTANNVERAGAQTIRDQNPQLNGTTSTTDLMARLRLILDQAHRVRLYPPNELLQTLLECNGSANETVSLLIEYLGSPDYETRHWAVEGLQVLVQDSRFQFVKAGARLALMRVAVSPDESEVLRQSAFMAAVGPEWSKGIAGKAAPPEPISEELLQLFAQSFNQKGADMVSFIGGKSVILNSFLSQTKQNFDAYRQALESTLLSGDSNQRMAAAIALAGLPGDKAQEVKGELVRALHEDSPLLPTAQAVQALGQLGSEAEDAVPAVGEYANRHQGDENIHRIAEQAVAAIQAAMNGPAEKSEPGAVKVLSNTQEPMEKPTQLTEFFNKLREELKDPEKRRTFVPEDRWMNVSAYWMLEQMREAREEIASQSDPEIAELIRRIPVGLNVTEDTPVDLKTEVPDPGEFIARALGVAERPDNGISSATLGRVKEWAARNESLLDRTSDFLFGTKRSDKLVEIARAIGAIDPKLYQATMKSFLDFHPEMDRLLRGTEPLEKNVTKR